MVDKRSTSGSWTFLFLAFTVTLTATLVVLFVGEVMGQAPCNLCWFQRVFMFSLAMILAIAAFRSDRNIGVYAVPLAVGGWIVAALHTLFYAGLFPKSIEPCGIGPSCSSSEMTILGGLPLPMLSLAAFTAILVLLLFAHGRSKP